MMIVNAMKMIRLTMVSTPSAMDCSCEVSSQSWSLSTGMTVSIQPDKGVQKSIPINPQNKADTSSGQLHIHNIRGLKRLIDARERAINSPDIKNSSWQTLKI